MKEGIPMDSFKNNSTFYKYLDSIHREGYDLLIYKRYILIISKQNIGVTILDIPKQYHNALLKGDKKDGSKRRSKSKSSLEEDDSQNRKCLFKRYRKPNSIRS